MSRRKHHESRSTRSGARKLKRNVSRKLQAIGKAILAPVKLLFLPGKAIELFHDRGVEIENSTRRGKRKRQNVAYRYLSLPIKLLLLPNTLYRQAVKRGKKKELLFLIPAALIAILFAFVAYQKMFRSAGLQQKYLVKAKHAVTDNNLVMAKTYMARILQEEEKLSDAQALHWVVILGRTGEQGQAEQILRRLAPDDAEGYPPAHRYTATEIVRQHELDGGDLDIKRLKWHLDNASDMDAELKSAWASYYVAMGNVEKAIDLLNEAAETYPQLYLTSAKISEENGFEDKKLNALRRAEVTFRNAIKKQPLDLYSRVSLVTTLVKLEKLEEAETILKTGLSLQQAPLLKRSLSDLYVVGYDKSKEANASLDRQMLFLKNAINADREALVPYHRIVALTAKTESAKERKELRSKLLSVVTNLNASSIDHCNLAHLHWQDSDLESTKWHLEQAWRLDPNFGDIAYRLAIAFAHSRKHPDLDWSEKLASHIVTSTPSEPVFHETLGEIYLIRNKFAQAVEELKLGLSGSQHPSKVHLKLSVAYKALGESRLAQIHGRKGAEGDLKLAKDER